MTVRYRRRRPDDPRLRERLVRWPAGAAGSATTGC
jgi:hypothetical protein